MSNGVSNFGSKQKIYGSQPKIDSFAEELKQAVSYQSLNTVNEDPLSESYSKPTRRGVQSAMAQNEPEWKQELARKKKLEADKKIIEKINKLKEKNETLKKEVKVKHAEVKSMKHHMEVYQGEYEKLQTHNGFLRKTAEEKDKEIRDLKAYIDTMSIGLMAKQPDLLEALERAKSPPQKTKTYDSSNITNGYRSPPVFRSPPAVHFSDTPSYSKPPSVDSIPPPPPPMGPPPFPKMNVHSQPSKMAPMPNMTEIYDESSFSSSRKKSDVI